VTPSPRIVFVSPPVTKPVEPGLSAAAAARALRARGVSASYLDAAIGWLGHTLAPARLARALEAAAAAGAPAGALLAYRRAVRAQVEAPPPLRRLETYRDRRVYSSAVSHLENALRLASAPHPGVRLRAAGIDVGGLRPESSAALAAFAAAPGPFDAYFDEELIPALARAGATHVAVSVTFADQAFAAFRLARRLAEALPGVTRLLGGPLVACWAAAGAPLATPPFRLFDRVVPGGAGADLDALARELGGAPDAAAAAEAAGAAGPLAVALDEPDWSAYLSPAPRVPAALGRGCPWRRCTFCPDHIHPRHAPCAEDALAAWLRAVAVRFPGGATLHLTDSALPPRHLERLADVIRAERLPLTWHGFVRVERPFAEPDFARHLAAGGCVMLQWGVESASPRLSRRLGKGAGPELAREVLRATAAAGIRNLVYLLFGLPTETDAEREETLAFVAAEGGAIHDLNHALLSLPRGSPMHRLAARFGITEVTPFTEGTDLSLYDDFRCGASHPRVEARRWLDRRFTRHPAVRRIAGDRRAPFKANHACYLA
jgi:hypothetical protein